jgi:hypothetical protein
MAKHFTLAISDGAFAYTPKTEQISAEAALDGFYIIRTTCTPAQIGAPAVVRAYKQLKVNERAFRTMKDGLEIRPIYHHLEDRVRAHVFLCMLAYHVSYELTQRLQSLLFTDETPISQADPVAPARRSPQGQANASAARTEHGHPAHTLPDLLSDLATDTQHPDHPRRRDLHAPQRTHPAASHHPATAERQARHVDRTRHRGSTQNPANKRDLASPQRKPGLRSFEWIA